MKYPGAVEIVVQLVIEKIEMDGFGKEQLMCASSDGSQSILIESTKEQCMGRITWSRVTDG